MRSEVMLAMSPGRDFRFDSMPVMSAPSSPKAFGYFYDYTSAPTSPTRAADIYAQFRDDRVDSSSFTFSFGQPETGVPPPALLPADELFEAGKIRPLKPIQDERGRQVTTPPTSSRSRRASRSLSPVRGDGALEKAPISSPNTNTDIKSGGSKRWRIRDLLLFRSASEGRATGRESKDPMRKFSITPPSSSSSSFRSGKGKGGSAASATEIHYMESRAAYEEQKKKTALPYHRNGLFGYLRFNPAINRITRGLNSRGRFPNYSFTIHRSFKLGVFIFSYAIAPEPSTLTRYEESAARSLPTTTFYVNKDRQSISFRTPEISS